MPDTHDRLAAYIREHHASHGSVEDQVVVANLLYEEGVASASQELTRKEIKALVETRGLGLDHKLGTILENLCDFEDGPFDVLRREFPPGNERYTISERLDEVINGRIEEIVEEDREALIDHVQDDHPVDEDVDSSAAADGAGVTVRTVVADGLEVVPENVEHELRSGSVVDQAEKIGDAIDALEESEETSRRDEYGRITFRHVAYRYQLTAEAVRLKEEDDE